MSTATTTRTTTSRRRLIALAAILALGTSAGAGTANAADGPKPGTTDAGLELSSLDQERMEQQKPLIAAADIIQAAVDKDAQANPLSGFSSIALGERSVILRWKGALSRTVEAAVEQARENVAIEVVGARLTGAEMQAKVAQVQQATKKLAGGVPFAVSLPIEGDKVVVEVEGDIITKLKTGLTALGLPIEVTHADVPEPAGRLDDTPEFYGGSKLTYSANGSGWQCAAGFAVRHWSGSEHLVTAGHCGYPGINFSNGNGSLSVGQASQENVNNDLLLVPTQNVGTTTGRVFNNRWGATTQTAMAVNGWHHPYHNEYLCTSGHMTGEVCGVRVDTSTAYSYCGTVPAWGNYECYGGMYRAYQGSGLRATQPGDSGGPVYNYNRSATGIISGGNSSGTTVIFQDFHTVNRIWGVVPK
jgi:hypothetical protein